MATTTNKVSALYTDRLATKKMRIYKPKKRKLPKTGFNNPITKK